MEYAIYIHLHPLMCSNYKTCISYCYRCTPRSIPQSTIVAVTNEVIVVFRITLGGFVLWLSAFPLSWANFLLSSRLLTCPRLAFLGDLLHDLPALPVLQPSSSVFTRTPLWQGVRLTRVMAVLIYTLNLLSPFIGNKSMCGPFYNHNWQIIGIYTTLAIFWKRLNQRSMSVNPCCREH